MSSFADQYALPATLTVAGLHQIVRFTKKVGEARHKYKIEPPETTGPPEFIRVFRAHQNSLEFFPMSLTSLWIGSVFFHPVPASALYLGYLIGREKFFTGYVEHPDKRLTGFKISIRCLLGLLIICGVGVGHKLVRNYGNIDLFEIIHEKVSSLRQ
ncbi:microsomal glutathione S-transferase 2-like [Physella acuta]|uniref:microsomal glutathione S-transferase 2-like n=1 Tax=Physella acuta TaxID=109671 RepID=UPI0027DE720F|nr:microsomal glutathione S-transferase 2-like [Physella acuta]